MTTTGQDYDGVRYDTFNDGPAVCKCGRTADYDGRRCCMCAPLTSAERTGPAADHLAACSDVACADCLALIPDL